MNGVAFGHALAMPKEKRASSRILYKLAKRYGVNQKTIAKWKKRSSVCDARTGPKDPRSTVLTIEEEAIIVAFRRHTLLPLDDCLYALQATFPHLTRSSLHRCLQRHGISQLPKIGAKVVSHGRSVAFQMAEMAVPRFLFAKVLQLIAELHPTPVTSTTEPFGVTRSSKPHNRGAS
jgi:hypothetical protein